MNENTNNNECKNPLPIAIVEGGRGKHIALMTALHKANIDDETRHDLIYSWTNGRTNSSKDLFDAEIDDLLWKIRADFNFTNKMLPALELERRNKRATILAVASKVGFFPNDTTDFDYFNSWMVNRSILKKPLWKYKIDELDKLVCQFKTIERHFEKSAETPGTKAWHIKNKMPFNSEN